MDGIGQPEILRILAVTDGLGLHRESIVVPLWTRGGGALRMRGRKLEITAPAEGDFDAWLVGLPSQISALDLSGLPRA